MKTMIRLLRGALLALAAGVRRHGGPRKAPLRDLVVVHDWQSGNDGAPRRLTSRETIIVTRSGIFAAHNPKDVHDGWRNGVGMLSRVGWLLGVGIAALVGWFRGRGPLGELRFYRDRRATQEPGE